MSGSAVVEIGRMVIPEALVRAVHDGSWTQSKSDEVLRRVFGDEPDWPVFYDLQSMIRQNEFFHKRSPQQVWGDVTQTSLGVEPGRAVVIASLGADMPIALDYRESWESPRVIYLGPSGWVHITSDVEALLDALEE